MDNLLIQFIPMLIATIIFFLFAIPIARRKGKGFGCCAMFLIPLAAPFMLFHLASLTDKSIVDRLEALESKVR